LLQQWGPTAVSTVLIFVVVFLIRKIDVNSKKDEERATTLRNDINKTLNSFGERLSRIEHEYVKNEMFYRELSGWRSEIHRLYDLINNQFANIIAIFK
jgi:hypothetical protein